MKLQTMPFVCALALILGVFDQAIFCLPPSISFMPAALAEEAKKELPPCLAQIAKATVIEDGALPSNKLKESLLAAQKLGPSAKDMLVDLAQTATPAGRLLCLALLKKIDPAQSQKLASAFKQEAGDQPVSYTSLSEHCHYSVSDILNDMASSQPLIKLLPCAASK